MRIVNNFFFIFHLLLFIHIFLFLSFAENHIYVDYIGAERANRAESEKGYKARCVNAAQTFVLWRNSFVCPFAHIIFAWHNKWIINDRLVKLLETEMKHLHLRASVRARNLLKFNYYFLSVWLERSSCLYLAANEFVLRHLTSVVVRIWLSTQHTK